MDMEREIGRMLNKLATIETKLDAALTALGDHEQRLRALEGRSGRRWETLVGEILKLLAAAVIGYIVGA